MLHDVEKPIEHTVEVALPASIAEPVRLELVEAGLDIATPASDSDVVAVVEEPRTVAATDSILVPASMTRRAKRRRHLQELPRGERWKRRLPEVCR